jgi:hypothetical protein
LLGRVACKQLVRLVTVFESHHLERRRKEF